MMFSVGFSSIVLVLLAAGAEARATFRIHRDFLKGFTRSPKGVNEQSIMASGPFEKEAKKKELELLKPEMMISISDEDLYMTKVNLYQLCFIFQ